jgi:hypothetical protein
VKIVSSENGFGVVCEPNAVLTFTSLDEDGNRKGNDVTLDSGCDLIMSFDIASSETGYAAAWNCYAGDGLGGIYLARFSTNGELIADPLDISSGEICENPTLAFSGSEYGVACQHWQNGIDNNQVYFFRTSLDGARLSSDLPVTEIEEGARYPKLVFGGSEYAVAWQAEDSAGMYQGIYVDRLDLLGSRIGETAHLTDHAAVYGTYINLVAADGDYASAWLNQFNVWFARAGCRE